jgi:hypothetical protein
VPIRPRLSIAWSRPTREIPRRSSGPSFLGDIVAIVGAEFDAVEPPELIDEVRRIGVGPDAGGQLTDLADYGSTKVVE